MHTKYSGRRRRSVHLFSPRILQLLSFLTRKQAWLSPPEIAQSFRLDGDPVSVMTIYRWFSLLREQVGLTYFPYPRMNLLDLADVYVRIQSPRSPAILAGIPFGHSFLVEVGLDGHPFLSQGYWVPGPKFDAFEEYWKTAKNLDLLEEFEILPAKNTHFIFSPFHDVLQEDGLAQVAGEIDNRHFEKLVRRHLNEPYEVRLADSIATAPIVIPLLSEHLWRHCSSRQVWQSIRAKGEEEIVKYVKGAVKKSLKKPGAALRLLQQHWRDLMQEFYEVFLQPVVFFPLGLIRNCPLISFRVHSGSTERMMEMALRASKRSVLTTLMPDAGQEGKCRVWCNPPSEELPFILRLMREYNRGPEPPVFGIIDVKATRELAQPEFCGFDWRSFDPVNLSWRFDGEKYVERLKEIDTRRKLAWPLASPGLSSIPETKGL
ncbi:MAG: hypothetical protein ACE5QW_09565 [Thermoplasmata archaeon]